MILGVRDEPGAVTALHLLDFWKLVVGRVEVPPVPHEEPESVAQESGQPRPSGCRISPVERLRSNHRAEGTLARGNVLERCLA